MEKYMTNLRIILCANSTSRLIAPIKSRCLLMRVAAPNHEEMLTVLNHVAKRAGTSSLPEDVANEIITDANGNMRKAILVFEAMKMQSYARSITFSLGYRDLCGLKSRPDLSISQPIAKPDWETYCYKVADMIIQEQTPQRVMEVRTKLYELLSHCIPATVVLKVRTLLDPCSLSYDSARRSRNVLCRKSMKT
jgi:replication factor C subunit 3/5